MKKQILLVEDNVATAEVMTNELKFLGYDVVLAENGAQAVELATAESPDLIIMDIALPKMDGLKAASQIRANPNTKAIPILAATARALPEDRGKCLAAGCSDYIAKPFTHDELNACIARLLKKNKLDPAKAEGPKKKVLIIDDNVDFSTLVRTKLAATGKYEVWVEHDGSSGISAARTFRPDLILLDVMMPDLDGPAVAEQISEQKDMAHIPIVFLTSIVSEEEARSHAGVIGGRRFVAKTEKLQNILSYVEQILRE